MWSTRIKTNLLPPSVKSARVEACKNKKCSRAPKGSWEMCWGYFVGCWKHGKTIYLCSFHPCNHLQGAESAQEALSATLRSLVGCSGPLWGLGRVQQWSASINKHVIQLNCSIWTFWGRYNVKNSHLEYLQGAIGGYRGDRGMLVECRAFMSIARALWGWKWVKTCNIQLNWCCLLCWGVCKVKNSYF